MILTAKQVEALDVGTTMGRLADLKNLLFIMDSWMTARGKADELNREADCSKYDLEALWHELPMYYTLLWSIIEAIDKSQAELLDTAKTLDAKRIEVLDAKELGLSVIDPAVVDYFNHSLFNNVYPIYNHALAETRQHPLTTRRYMWKVAY